MYHAGDVGEDVGLVLLGTCFEVEVVLEALHADHAADKAFVKTTSRTKKAFSIIVSSFVRSWVDGRQSFSKGVERTKDSGAPEETEVEGLFGRVLHALGLFDTEMHDGLIRRGECRSDA